MHSHIFLVNIIVCVVSTIISQRYSDQILKALVHIFTYIGIFLFK